MKKSEALFKRDQDALGDVLKLRFYPLAADRGIGWAVANTGYCHPNY